MKNLKIRKIDGAEIWRIEYDTEAMQNLIGGLITQAGDRYRVELFQQIDETLFTRDDAVAFARGALTAIAKIR